MNRHDKDSDYRADDEGWPYWTYTNDQYNPYTLNKFNPRWSSRWKSSKKHWQ